MFWRIWPWQQSAVLTNAFFFLSSRLLQHAFRRRPHRQAQHQGSNDGALENWNGGNCKTSECLLQNVRPTIVSLWRRFYVLQIAFVVYNGIHAVKLPYLSPASCFIGVCALFRSGMVTEADPQHWKPDDIRPYVQVHLHMFMYMYT